MEHFTDIGRKLCSPGADVFRTMSRPIRLYNAFGRCLVGKWNALPTTIPTEAVWQFYEVFVTEEVVFETAAFLFQILYCSAVLLPCPFSVLFNDAVSRCGYIASVTDE
jgi:hypothetical protein